ncbi:MAG TPA: hypothetical protein VFW11_02125 [Cyclobacteriaceae bacterium]|nr:hypothetical protein [Cyclobacteriaceae bacterium]
MAFCAGRFLLVAVVTLTVISTFAQVSYNSPYSFYGVGLINNKSSSLNRGLAGTGIGIQDDYNLNYVNPASYASIVSPITHIYEVGTYVESNRFETTTLSESKTNGGMSNLSYWFKLSPRWASVAGLSPYSSVSYSIKATRDLAILDNVEYTREGAGNITQLYFGNAFNVVKNFSVGLNISYLFGSIHRYEYLSTSILPGLTYDDKIFIRKFDFDAGLQYKFHWKDKKLVVGMTLDDGLKLEGTRTGKLYDSEGDTLKTISNSDVQYTLPASAGVGLSLQTKLFLWAGDVKYENWSNADIANKEIILQDVWKLSGGFMYKGNANSDSYLGAVGLRGGVHAENFYQKLNGRNVLNWGASAGLSFPVFDGRSCINFIYCFDKLGTVSDGLILQHSNKFMLDVVIRDLWGGKRKFD